MQYNIIDYSISLGPRAIFLLGLRTAFVRLTPVYRTDQLGLLVAVLRHGDILVRETAGVVRRPVDLDGASFLFIACQ